MKTRTQILVGLLGLVAAAGAAAKAETLSLERELKEIALNKEVEFKIDGSGKAAKTEVVSAVTASRRYLLFGEATGKVSVYVQSGDGDNGALSGVEYFYTRVGGDWVVTESGMCTSEACHVEAQELFDKRAFSL